jgi:two-component system, OmpR family, sensor histidine kinase ResE
MSKKNSLSKLRSQLILTFLVGSIGIVIAIGLPVVLLINNQTHSQTNMLLNQAKLTTKSSLAREQSDLQNLALLISQRPTLQQLLEKQQASSLNPYLDTLRKSVQLDLLLVCDANNNIVGASSSMDVSGLCTRNDLSGFVTLSQEPATLLFAASELPLNSSHVYKVILGRSSSSVLLQLQKVTGLFLLLGKDGRIMESSDPVLDLKSVSLQDLPRRTAPESQASSGTLVHASNGKSYLLSSISMNSGSDVELIGALDINQQVQTQENLSRTLIFGLIFVILIAFALGIWLSQRLSSPLNHLANVAADFSHGNLHSPVSLQASTWEISQLANTLEDARVALEHSMAQLESEKAWVEHILDSIVEGILTLDHQNQITFASAGMGRIIGDDPEPMIDQNVDQFFYPAEGEMAFSKQLSVGAQQQTITVKLKNGPEKLLSVSRAKLVPPEARTSSQVLVIRDVTNEEYIHRLLGDFLANITHEFRTPLAALEASSELMLDNLSHLSHPEMKELLVSLHLGIADLQTLIDNLIQAASIEAGRFKVSRQPVVFDSILRDSLKVIQPLADKYQLRLVCSPPDESPILVLADQRRMVQVLVNLLSNAIKHSPEHGEIRVNYHLEGQKLYVEVSDEGNGIPMSKRSMLFIRFSYLDSSDERARQGAGLGLSVVKAIVEAHHGSVGIKDSPNGGASFWFTLPVLNEDGK